MRFEDIDLTDLDSTDTHIGSYVVLPTDELIDITNTKRMEQGNTDLVGTGYENDVYYSYYLHFNTLKMEINLQSEVHHGEKDDFVWYNIELSPEEKNYLLWKIINSLLVDI